MTQICFFEALGVLKSKLDKQLLSRQRYVGGCVALMGLKTDRYISLDEVPLEDTQLLLQAEDLARKHDLDFSDALQILSVQYGRFRGGTGPSRTVLATGDQDLAKAAGVEGLRVWNIMKDDRPPGVTV